jgi:lipopolysaccharide transport system ATP-binding protein
LQTSSDVAISVRGLAKSYRLGQSQALHGSLREAIAGAAARALHRGERARRETFWALDHVDLDVERGQVLGIIGRNGAGKTTLLKILSRITEPTAGEALIRGRVGSLLEVGTGFHGDLTGRENIFLNGAILGMKRREIERRFDEIVAFAEVERFIDTPVKRYSSGMYLRLAFAVAAHLEPEILIVDEVLAVGDAAFQRKCLGKMGEVSGEGRTVLLVSHNLTAITQLATQCLWLDQGKVRALGEAAPIVAQYLSGDLADGSPGHADLRDPALREGVPKRTNRDLTFESVRLVDDDGRSGDVFFEGEPLHVKLGIASRIQTSRLELLVFCRALDGVLVFTLLSGLRDVDVRPGEAEVSVTLPRLSLRPGRYQLDLYMLTASPQDYLLGAISFEVAGARGGDVDPRHARDQLGLVTVEHEWSDVSQGVTAAR